LTQIKKQAKLPLQDARRSVTTTDRMRDNVRRPRGQRADR